MMNKPDTRPFFLPTLSFFRPASYKQAQAEGIGILWESSLGKLILLAVFMLMLSPLIYHGYHSNKLRKQFQRDFMASCLNSEDMGELLDQSVDIAQRQSNCRDAIKKHHMTCFNVSNAKRSSKNSLDYKYDHYARCMDRRMKGLPLLPGY